MARNILSKVKRMNLEISEFIQSILIKDNQKTITTQSIDILVQLRQITFLLC